MPLTLKEKLAASLCQREVHPASETSRAWFEAGFLAGFDEAREMATKIAHRNSAAIGLEIGKKIQVMGEEVQGANFE